MIKLRVTQEGKILAEFEWEDLLSGVRCEAGDYMQPKEVMDLQHNILEVVSEYCRINKCSFDDPKCR